MARGHARDNHLLPLSLLLPAMSAKQGAFAKAAARCPAADSDLSGSFNLPKELRPSPLQFPTTPIGRDKLKTEGESMS